MVAASALAASAWLARRRRAPAAPADEPAGARPARLSALRLAGLALGVIGALLFGGAGQAVALWYWTVATLGAAALALLFLEAPREEPPVRGPRLELALLALALAASLYALAAHRPDADDAFYVNLAVAAADAPDAPLLQDDTLHGVAGLPIHLPIYRLHGFELWNGALAYLSGVPAIQVFHFGAVAFAAFLVPIAHARLFRLLTPKHWLAAVATLLVVLVAAGETHRWYGNFGLVRIWQGKAIQLFVFTPLVYAAAIEFALRPTLARWGLLASAQIAALGSSSAALWAAPAASAIALCSALPLTRRGLRRFAIGLLASAYVLGAGLLAKGWMQADAASQQPVSSPQEVRERELAAHELDRPGVRLEQALREVLGDARLRRVAIACVLVAWAASGTALARRFALVAPLAVALVLLHPSASSWVVANATGESYWRSLWALPVPIAMALTLLAPLAVGAAWRRRWLAPAAWLCLLGVFALLVPGPRGPSLENGVRLGWPSLKVEPAAYAWAAELSASVAARLGGGGAQRGGGMARDLSSARVPAARPRDLPRPLSAAARRRGDRAAPLDDGDRRRRGRRTGGLASSSETGSSTSRSEACVCASPGAPSRFGRSCAPRTFGSTSSSGITRSGCGRDSRSCGYGAGIARESCGYGAGIARESCGYGAGIARTSASARLRLAARFACGAARYDSGRRWNPRDIAPSRCRFARASASWCRSPPSTRKPRWLP